MNPNLLAIAALLATGAAHSTGIRIDPQQRMERKDRCFTCNKEIPIGRPGRNCPECRKTHGDR